LEADLVGLGEPAAQLGIDLLGTVQAQLVHVVGGRHAVYPAGERGPHRTREAGAPVRTRVRRALGPGRVRTKWGTRWARRGRSTPAKRKRACRVMRDFVAFSATSPCSRAAATKASNATRRAGEAAAKCSSTVRTSQECGMLRATKRWPHRGQRH